MRDERVVFALGLIATLGLLGVCSLVPIVLCVPAHPGIGLLGSFAGLMIWLWLVPAMPGMLTGIICLSGAAVCLGSAISCLILTIKWMLS